MYMYVYVCVCAYTYIHTCMCKCMHIYSCMEGTRTLPDYLVNRVLTKNEGPHGKKIARQEIAVERAVGVWVHRDS